MKQRIEAAVTIYLGYVNITDGPATIDVVDDGPVELVIPVQLGALGWICIRFGG